jgi:hypothetical protein
METPKKNILGMRYYIFSFIIVFGMFLCYFPAILEYAVNGVYGCEGDSIWGFLGPNAICRNVKEGDSNTLIKEKLGVPLEIITEEMPKKFHGYLTPENWYIGEGEVYVYNRGKCYAFLLFDRNKKLVKIYFGGN